jgi:hypothetical protein
LAVGRHTSSSNEVGRLADPGFATNLRHRHAISALLENETPSARPKTSMPSSLSARPSQRIIAENSSQKRSSFVVSAQRAWHECFNSQKSKHEWICLFGRDTPQSLASVIFVL